MAHENSAETIEKCIENHSLDFGPETTAWLKDCLESQKPKTGREREDWFYALACHIDSNRRYDAE